MLPSRDAAVFGALADHLLVRPKHQEGGWRIAADSRTQDVPRYPIGLHFEIAAIFEIGNQSRLRGLPPQEVPSPSTRRRAVDTSGMSRPAKVLPGFRGRLTDDGDVQASTDYFGDFSKWHSLVADRVIAGSTRPLLKRQPIERRSIE